MPLNRRKGGGCPYCYEPVGHPHELYCVRRGTVRARHRMFYIEFNLTGIEGWDRHHRPIYHKGRWPKLFPSVASAEDWKRRVGDQLFANVELAGIRSATIMGVWVDA